MHHLANPMLVNRKKCTSHQRFVTVVLSILVRRFDDSAITAKQSFSSDAFVRRGRLSPVHFNVVIIHLDLLEIVLPNGLLRVHVLATEILHPCVVADELLLRAVSS
jgi:hypothetical protein